MTLSEHEQRLIAEAIALGKLRRIPMGQCGAVKMRRGRKIDIVSVKMVRALADRCLPDRAIAEQVGKTKKAVQNIRYRHGITAGRSRVL